MAFQRHMNGARPFDLKIRLRMKSGEYGWFRLCGQARWLESGETSQMAGSLLDITQEHWSSQRLAAQYAGSKILAESTTFEEALSKILTRMCHEMTWAIGSFWTMAASDTQPECSAIVDVGFPAHPEFVTESRGRKFSRRQGCLVGSGPITNQPGFGTLPGYQFPTD